MKISQYLSIGLLLSLFFSVISLAQTLSPEDVQELDKETGIGCIEEKPVTEKADYYFVCRSRKSGDQAWNASLYRSKVACGKDKFSIYFNVPPSLPIENGIYGAQVEVDCGEKP